MKRPNNFLNQTKESSKRDIPSDTKGKTASRKTFIANNISYQEDYIDYKYGDNCFLREINASGKESLSISSSMSNKTEPVTFRPYNNPIAQKIIGLKTKLKEFLTKLIIIKKLIFKKKKLMKIKNKIKE